MKRTHSNVLHKKRFGQYFSGKKVADMLFSLLPKDRIWKTVVDPMAGIGDMLVSVQNCASNPQMLGVEIDEIVAKDCATRLPNATIVTKDAFKANKFGSPFVTTTIISSVIGLGLSIGGYYIFKTTSNETLATTPHILMILGIIFPSIFLLLFTNKMLNMNALMIIILK